MWSMLSYWSSIAAQKCSPQILATSKQIYNEAYGVLYYGNTFDVELYTALCTPGLSTKTVNISINAQQIDQSKDDCVLVEHPCVGVVFRLWPLELRKFGHFRIIITSSNEETNNSMSARHRLFGRINHNLSSLCCFLAGSNALESVVIELREGSNQGSRWVPARTIWQLLKLANAKLEFKNMPNGPIDYLQREVKHSVPQPVDTFAQAMAIRMDGKAPAILDSTDYVDFDYDKRITACLKNRKPIMHNMRRRKADIDLTRDTEVMNNNKEAEVIELTQEGI